LSRTNVEGVSFASISSALEGVDRSRLTIVPLFAGEGGGFTAHLVVWPPNSESQECLHDGFAEAAHIVAGSILDEDGREHRAGELWMRPAHHVHRPRAGAEGAQLVLWRVNAPAL
jgi:hypothetical protein